MRYTDHGGAVENFTSIIFLHKSLGATIWRACKMGEAVYVPRHDDLRAPHPKSPPLAAQLSVRGQRPAADSGVIRLAIFRP